MAPAPKEEEKRMQFSWWLERSLGERFLRYVEKQGPKVKQRQVAEIAIERYLDAMGEPKRAEQPKETI